MMMRQTQKGAALLVSLIILLVLSIIGISAMRGGLLQTLMAANQQQAEMAFSAADAGVSAMVAQTSQEKVGTGTILGTKATGPINGPATPYDVAADGSVAEATDPAPKLDEDRDVPITAAKVDLTYENCVAPSTTACVGYSAKVGSQTGCHFFRLDGTGTVGDTTASVSQWVEAPSTAC